MKTSTMSKRRTSSQYAQAAEKRNAAAGAVSHIIGRVLLILCFCFYLVIELALEVCNVL